MVKTKQKPTQLPLVVYDYDCRFCSFWIERWKIITRNNVRYASYQEVAHNFPNIHLNDFKKAIKLIMPNGEVYSAAQAVFLTLFYADKKIWIRLYQHMPGFATVTEFLYSIIAKSRKKIYWITKLLWGFNINPKTYVLTRWLFLKLLGVIYFIAFLSIGVQILGLIGAQGILPASQYLDIVDKNLGAEALILLPTIFWLNASDIFLQTITLIGALLSIIFVLGYAQRALAILLFIFYLSILGVGQTFLSFQWDILLLEVGFLTIFFAPNNFWPKSIKKTIPPKAILILFWFLIFRLNFSSGMVKLISGDQTWKNLSALDFHYQTQPIPNPLAWFFHQFPPLIDRLSTIGMFTIELFIPFLIFLPTNARYAAAAILASLQIMILMTGNYTFFNLLTLALILLLVDDRVIKKIIPKKLTITTFNEKIKNKKNTLKKVSIGFLVGIIFFLGTLDIARLTIYKKDIPKPIIKVVNNFRPFHIVNNYGLFATMTTTRYEIIIQGSNDGETWLDYEFKYKPQALNKIPPQVAPHQPRLDWQMWFAALGPAERSPWFSNFIARLLEGSEDVISLLMTNPYPDQPPKFIRAIIYEYKFSDFKTRKSLNHWWTREYKGIYFPTVSLN